jgi:hypothetical protein
MSRTSTAPTGGLRVWVPLIAPIGAWAMHEVATSSLSRLSCNDHRFTWVQHSVTAVTVLVVLGCMAVAAGLVRAGRGASEEDGSAAGRTVFIGMLALLSGGVNLALILLEGTYVAVIHACK